MQVQVKPTTITFYWQVQWSYQTAGKSYNIPCDCITIQPDMTVLRYPYQLAELKSNYFVPSGNQILVWILMELKWFEISDKSSVRRLIKAMAF